LSFVQGAGAFEIAARHYLMNEVKKTVQGVTKCLPKFSVLIKIFVSIDYLSKHIWCLQTWISVLNLVLKLWPMLFLWCPRHLLRTLGLTLKMLSFLLRYTFFKTHYLCSFIKEEGKLSMFELCHAIWMFRESMTEGI
jgi:hypothetical protein